jgi:hypothetical protein
MAPALGAAAAEPRHAQEQRRQEMKRSQLTPKQQSSVACPTCGAAAGERCELNSGGQRFEPHLLRTYAMTEAIEKRRTKENSNKQQTTNNKQQTTNNKQLAGD